MPIRVNLKELFPSDSQELAMDKLNFNFNKLLELGVGEVGPTGLTGPQGPAGPIGLTGATGQRGNTWLVDSGNPDTHTFNDLLDGDFYLDTASFAVWQWSEASPAVWTEIVDFEAIVNYYISLSPSPFNRATSTTNSPGYDRFITFNRRGNTTNDVQSDISRGQFNTSDNDVLFLTNYNELLLPTAISNFPTNSGELYDALLKISVNHTEASSEQTGRYHFELSSIYLDETTSPAELKISELKHNLKAKFVKTNVSATSPIPNTNTWMNIAQFSLSVPEPDPIIGIDQNGIFEWVTPKYNNEGGSPTRSEVTLMFGAEEGLTEFSANAIIGDGLDISTLTDSFSAGIKYNLEDSLILPYTTGNANFALFNVSDGLDGFFFNDKLVQTGGNIEQIHTYPAKYETKYGGTPLQFFSSNANKRLPSITTNGKYLIHTAPHSTLYTSADHSVSGLAQIWALDKTIKTIKQITTDSVYVQATSGGPIAATYDARGHQNNREFGEVPLTNVTDVAISGKYLYFTRVKPQDYTAPLYSTVNRRTFIIAELDSDGGTVLPLGYYGPTTDTLVDDRYNSLRRVEVVGHVAYVMGVKETTTDWVSSKSRFMALDISSPAAIRELSYLQESHTNDNYLDFAISKERAFIVNFKDDSNSVQIKRVDISNPEKMVAGTNITTVIASGATNKPASIKIHGDKLFLTYGTKLYIYKIDYNNSAALVSQITGGSFEVDSSSELVDIIINDNYAYIVGENTVNGAGKVYIINIDSHSVPYLVSTLSDNRLTAPSKMAQVGNKLYVTTSTGTGGLSSQTTGLVELSIEGIRSSSADISNVKSSNLLVSNDAFVGEKLNVGHSLSVGAGGISIDYGAGLSTNGPIKVSSTVQYLLNDVADIPEVNLVDLTIKHTLQETSGNSLINFMNSSLESGSYESPIAGSKFIAQSGSNTTETIAGSDVTINSNLTQNAYGYKFNRASGTTASGKKAYGVYIQNADENYLEGKLTIDGTDNYIETTSAPAIASQVADENQFMSGYVNHTNYDYVWTRVGNVVTCTGNAASSTSSIPIPIGTIGAFCTGSGAAGDSGSPGIYVSGITGGTSVTLTLAATIGVPHTTASKRYTFAYVIA